MAIEKRKPAKTSSRPTLGSSHKGGRGPAAGKPKRTEPSRPARKVEGPAPRKPAKKAASPARKAEPRKVDAPPKVRTPARKVEVRPHESEAARQLALKIASAALDKKAVNVQIVDVTGRIDYADFLVLMSGNSDRHALAIADGIEEAFHKEADAARRRPIGVEGRTQATWIVLDYGSVVAHVFREEARAFYDLDTLWQDARRIPLAAEPS